MFCVFLCSFRENVHNLLIHKSHSSNARAFPISGYSRPNRILWTVREKCTAHFQIGLCTSNMAIGWAPCALMVPWKMVICSVLIANHFSCDFEIHFFVFGESRTKSMTFSTIKINWPFQRDQLSMWIGGACHPFIIHISTDFCSLNLCVDFMKRLINSSQFGSVELSKIQH